MGPPIRHRPEVAYSLGVSAELPKESISPPLRGAKSTDHDATAQNAPKQAGTGMDLHPHPVLGDLLELTAPATS